jgi:hypothetical protein
MDPTNRPWQPRVDKDPELNPSVRTTEPEASIDNRTLEEVEEDSEESEANENEAEPIKIHK